MPSMTTPKAAKVPSPVVGQALIQIPGPMIDWMGDPENDIQITHALVDVIEAGHSANGPKGYGVKVAVDKAQLKELRGLAEDAVGSGVDIPNLKTATRRFIARAEVAHFVTKAEADKAAKAAAKAAEQIEADKADKADKAEADEATA